MVPSKIELQWLNLIHSIEDLQGFFENMEEKIREIKTFKGLGF